MDESQELTDLAVIGAIGFGAWYFFLRTPSVEEGAVAVVGGAWLAETFWPTLEGMLLAL